MFLGIDIGSSSSKVLALDGAGNILGSAVMNIGTQDLCEVNCVGW